MDLKQLSKEEIENIYYKHMITDFPQGELKPLSSIIRLIKRKKYICYGLYDNSELLAYACLVTSKSYLLIDYYAVCEQYRSKGIGSKFLSMLKDTSKNYNGIIVEVESFEYAPNEAERLVRQRRIEFYKKNGMKMTNILSILFNVEYSIMCLCNITLGDSDIYEAVQTIYKEIIPSNYFSKYVEISYLK
ncbi:GNAT family N-acetyltransferase [Clostridium sp.]|uniref:GNAT family N-acetyltransferase n=1 Tax=Clostridium sp. TaxID=1506 RepID=UPI0026328176|nr:GNAT family N-acetyltransferase [Clostridium sp.]